MSVVSYDPSLFCGKIHPVSRFRSIVIINGLYSKYISRRTNDMITLKSKKNMVSVSKNKPAQQKVSGRFQGIALIQDSGAYRSPLAATGISGLVAK